MISQDTEIRVRYGETDQMGYVYYGNYALYCEVGRTELLRSLGLTYKQIEESGFMLPVLSFNSTYYKPAKYDELIKVVTTINIKPSVKVIFNYHIYNEGGELVNISESTLGFINSVTNKPARPPHFFLDIISPYFS